MPRTPEQFKEIREKTRSNILNAAMKLFAQKSFHGTSMNDIALAAGVSKGLAYNYFHSKQNILEAIFEQFVEMGEGLENAINTVTDPYEKIKLMINISFNYVKSNEEYWLLYTSIIFQPEVMDKALEVINQIYAGFYSQIEKIFRQMGIKNVAAEAKIFGGALDGIFLNYFVDKENYPFEKVRKQLIKKYSRIEIEKILK